MFHLLSFTLVLLLLIVAAYLLRAKQNLPPSPKGFPVIGHLHLLKEPVHRCLRDLSQSLGPVLSLRLGSCLAVVVTSSSAAEEFLSHENDVVFANRHVTTMYAYVLYSNTAVSVAPYGDHWRNLRCICTAEIFSPARARRLFDFDGYVKRAKKLGSKLDKFLQELLHEHRGKTEFKNTMITHLLTLQESQPEYYTDETIKGLVLVRVMLFAGSETTSVTLEWAMSNLLNHPDVLAKVKTELNNIVSREGRLMEESDMSTCTYLNNRHCWSHTHRPVTCKVAGYDIPRGTWLFINAWAIQRDPKVWDEPEVFKPERFHCEELKIQHGKFLPFGMGRRACPGMGLAQLILSLALGSLIQCFDWERDEVDMAVDMSEGKGHTMPKAVPLVAKCKPSSILDNCVI
ncbi:hypothetical protein YC2023_046374 [Brassica napus]